MSEIVEIRWNLHVVQWNECSGWLQRGWASGRLRRRVCNKTLDMDTPLLGIALRPSWNVAVLVELENFSGRGIQKRRIAVVYLPT